MDQKSNRKVTKSAEDDQDKVSNIGQGLTATSIISPTIELSSSDRTSRGSKHDLIDVTREISYEEEPNLVDLWESLLLDAGCSQLNPNIHDDVGKQSSVVSKVDTSVNNKDIQAARLGNSLCPLESLNNFELNGETTTGPNYGGYPEIMDDQITKIYQLEAISNDGLFKMDNNMDSYLEIMAWPSSPTCFSFSGFWFIYIKV